MGTDVFAWHGYAELHLDGRWLKVSPTFDPATCRRAGVAALEWDGARDALLQAFDGTATRSPAITASAGSRPASLTSGLESSSIN
jgi:hypothetical protein